MALIDKVRSACNYRTTARDDDLQDLILAAIADLRKMGIDAAEDTANPRTAQAIILFCRAYGQTDDPNADRFMQMYEGLKASLALQEGDPYVV